MKFTQEDLLNAMGLKVGDTVSVTVRELKTPIIGTIDSQDYDNEYEFVGLGVFGEEEAISLDEIITNGYEYTVIPQPKYTLTETEKHIVLAIDEMWKWIARWGDNDLFVFTTKPRKLFGENEWFGDEYTFGFPFNHLFQFIQWSDTEPVSLDELREIAKK